jgi:hypothetical protein
VQKPRKNYDGIFVHRGNRYELLLFTGTKSVSCPLFTLPAHSPRSGLTVRLEAILGCAAKQAKGQYSELMTQPHRYVIRRNFHCPAS